MKTKEFDYKLPKELIAQEPIEPRDHSRLLVLDRSSGEIKHDHFFNLRKYLRKDDILVLNDSKVIPARLIGWRRKKGRPVEIFLLKRLRNGNWQCLIGGKSRERVEEVDFPGSKLRAKIIKNRGDGTWEVKFNLKEKNFWKEVKKIGEVPTPPYVKKHKKFRGAEQDYYQTIYAREEGSVAAPTAGFHFTQKLVESLKKRGIGFVFITLHVGLGTFAPIREERVEEHKMHAEWFELKKKSADLLNQAKREGRRIIAVGTTSARVLETCATTPLPRLKKFLLKPQSGETDLFIMPGYKFKFVDGQITNFHIPHSTLLLLVSAFAGKEKIIKAYKEAIVKKYRFYSFGDAMFLT